MLCLFLLLLVSSVIGGPIAAYTACTACCGSVHATDYLVPLFGLGTTGFCILEACISPIPGVCADPRDNICVLSFYGALALPTP